MANCPKCGKKLDDNARLCPECGNAILQSTVPAEPTPVSPQEPDIPAAENAEKKKNGFSPLVVGGIVIGALLLLIVLFSAIGGGEADYGLYVRDNELFFSDFSGKSLQLTTNLDDEDYDAPICVSKDGKSIFYLDQFTDDGDDCDLYFRKNGKDAVKLDSDVSSFVVNEDSDLVTYLKNGVLYQHDLKEKERISGDVSLFRVSEDGSAFFWLSEDGEYFMKVGNKEKEKLDDDIENGLFSKDMKTLYYLKEEGLYLKTFGKEKVKIADHVMSLYAVYDSDLVYYTKGSEEEVPLSHFLQDDVSDDRSKDTLRTELSEETTTVKKLTLCFYNGKKEVAVTEELTTSGFSIKKAKDAPVLFVTYRDANAAKFKLSECNSVSDAVSLLGVQETKPCYLIVSKSDASTPDAEEILSAKLNAEGDVLYYLCDTKDGVGDLYTISIKGKSIGKSELYDSDVSTSRCNFIDNDRFLYFKDIKDGAGTLYCEKKAIAENVDTDRLDYHEESGTLLFMMDWNEEKEYGTLMMWRGKKAVKVQDDVYAASFTSTGNVLYLYEYNTEKGKGALYVFQGKKSKKVDDDVSAIVETTTASIVVY